MSYQLPEDFYYTKDHEWAQVDENIVTIGVTEFAQEQLGEVEAAVAALPQAQALLNNASKIRAERAQK